MLIHHSHSTDDECRNDAHTLHYPQLSGSIRRRTFYRFDIRGPDSKIIHRDDLEKFNNNMITYQSTGVIKEEYRIWKSKKECIRVYASVFQIVNKSGEVIRHAGFVHKITTGK